MKNRVIIITRSNEYGATEKFQDAINSAASCNYNQCHELKKFIEARKQLKDRIKEKESEYVAYVSILGEVYDWNWNKKEELAIKQLINIIKVADLQSNKAYASFDTAISEKKWEVILVLCDNVGIVRTESIGNVKLFLDSICKDLEVTEDDNNILYVHADQLGFEHQADGVIVDNHNIFCKTGLIVVDEWAESNKETFYRIGFFFHENRDKLIFHDNILEMNFDGETHFQKEINKAEDVLTDEDI